MHRIRLVLVPVLAVIMAVIAGSAVSAATSTSGTAKFTVPVSVSLAQGAGGTCVAGACDFGSPALGVQSSTLTEQLIISSNDSTGFQLSIISPQASWVESGTGCTANAAHNVPASTLQYSPTIPTGGTGTGGSTTAGSLSATAQNLFGTAPTMTGTITEMLILSVTPGAATPANNASCAYVIGYTVSVVGL
jgi:hypothetical protein